MRLFIALFVLVGLVGGCDTSDDLRPIEDMMIVGLTEAGALRLETETYDYCGGSIYVDSQIRPGRVMAEVKGADPSAGICDGLVAGTWEIALPDASPLDVSIQHKGETDRYRVTFGGAGRQLEAVSISTTRPGPR